MNVGGCELYALWMCGEWWMYLSSECGVNGGVG